MTLNKQNTNMYAEIYECWNPLAGECKYQCYKVKGKCLCFVSVMKNKLSNKSGKYVFPHVRAKYSGDYRLVEKEFTRKFKPDTIVFVCDCTDLFHPNVSSKFIYRILEYCRKFPETIFLFQTKNPHRYLSFFKQDFPKKSILGTTVQSDNNNLTPLAPTPYLRCCYMYRVGNKFDCECFITIEPILEFDSIELVDIIKIAKPDWVWIGANSKGGDLPEPSSEKIKALIKELEKFTDVRIKKNLNRLLNRNF